MMMMTMMLMKREVFLSTDLEFCERRRDDEAGVKVLK